MAFMRLFSMIQSTRRTTGTTERRRTPCQRASTAVLVAVATVFAPMHAYADCGVDGTLIRDAAVRGLSSANNLVNSSAADIMSSSQPEFIGAVQKALPRGRFPTISVKGCRARVVVQQTFNFSPGAPPAPAQ